MDNKILIYASETECQSDIDLINLGLNIDGNNPSVVSYAEPIYNEIENYWWMPYMDSIKDLIETQPTEITLTSTGFTPIIS